MGPDTEIARRTRAMIETAPRRGYIANLGHGITPDVPVHAMKTFVRTVQEYRYE
jgi:uroporphyrinogen decarboxylase